MVCALFDLIIWDIVDNKFNKYKQLQEIHCLFGSFNMSEIKYLAQKDIAIKLVSPRNPHESCYKT